MTYQHHPVAPLGIDHVVFMVADIDRAVRFYRDVLNCQPGFTYDAIGMEQLWFGNALIVLWDQTHPGAAAALPDVQDGKNVDHVCLSCGPFDLEVLRTHLLAHNVRIDREAIHGGARGMGQSLYIFDPDGNKLEIKGPPLHPDLPGASA